jgi:hypothetical protein
MRHAILASILLAAPCAAHALEQYMGVQFQRSESSCEGFRQGVAPLGLSATCKDTDDGWRVNYGVYYTPHFGMEMGYQDAGEGRAEAFAPNGTHVLTLNAPLKVVDLVALGRIPLPNGFSIVGRAGFARWDYEVRSSTGTFGASKKDTTFTYGLAFNWRWLTLGYDVIQDVGQENQLNPSAPAIEQDVKRWSVGLRWTF